MNITKKEIIIGIVIIFTILISYYFYYNPSEIIARGQGTVLSDNWWEALNWVKNNTAECAVVATYWDPGHFITGIARRAVVFDGASQSSLLILEKNESAYPEGLTVEDYSNGIKQIIVRDGNKEMRARIKDIAITLYTDNETQAIDILKDYRKPGCDLYYIASSDLVSKSVWWTYFSTWDPVDKGKQYSYVLVPLTQTKPLISENMIAYEYVMSEQQKFIVYDNRQGRLTAQLQQGNMFLSVEKLFDGSTGVFTITPEADVSGTLWLSSDKGIVIYMSPELENSLFTRMYFFNGANLEHFQPIGNWGGEVKLYNVTFD